eukprot:c25399_g1_i1 orf=65-1879(+)
MEPTAPYYCGIRRTGVHHSMCTASSSYIASLLLVLSFEMGQALSPDGVALLAFKEAVVDSRGVLANWNPADNFPCNWTGVGCDYRSNHVVVINLAGCNLSGYVSTSLENLVELHNLYLEFNNFGGSIPRLANCRSIQTISLHHNKLTGEIPVHFGNCSCLQALYLQNNMLSGSLPPYLGSLHHILSLDLSYNSFCGNIPRSFGNLSNLHYLFLGNVHLCGNLGFLVCPHASDQPVSMAKGLQPTVAIHQKKKGLSAIKVTAICMGVFLLFKLYAIFYILHRWSMEKKYQEIKIGIGGKLVMFQGGTSIASSHVLLKNIGRIRQKHIIGEGGYGVVYKLVLNDSTILAVKKLKQCLESIRLFEAELETLGAIKHRNLVKLYGYCVSTTVKLLIYEYLPNGTVEHLLHEGTCHRKPIDWATRRKIALGVARGLEYLHHSCDPQIIHRDVSSSNILLDSDLEPHLSDFGLAKVIGMYDSHITATLAGTFGYIAPEYAEFGRATDKVDVYSYGVFLLELLSGRRPAEISLERDGINLAGLVLTLQEKGQEAEIIEDFLKETTPEEELQSALHVACLCILKNPEDRPSMKMVVEYLEKDVSIGYLPRLQ